MKFINQLLDQYRPLFHKGGKYEKLYPLFEATETFFFNPPHVTITSPHIRDSLDLKRMMILVFMALLPPFLFGIYNAGYQSNIVSHISPTFFGNLFMGLYIVLPIVIVSYGVGLFWEILFASIRGHDISEGFFVTGLLFPMTLPPTISLWQVAVGISFGVVIGKEIFGGTGRNFLNPALTARAFLFFAYPSSMSGDHVWRVIQSQTNQMTDAITAATPLSCAMPIELTGSIASILNDYGYSFTRLLFGCHPGSIGETSAFLCYLGAIFLIITGIGSYRIIIGGIIGALFTGYLFNSLYSIGLSPWFSLPPLYHLVMGGFALGIVYMATDPVSAPGIEHVKWIYGFAIGALTVCIRVVNPAYPEGVMLAILFMNIFAPLLDYIAIQITLRKRVPNV